MTSRSFIVDLKEKKFSFHFPNKWHFLSMQWYFWFKKKILRKYCAYDYWFTLYIICVLYIFFFFWNNNRNNNNNNKSHRITTELYIQFDAMTGRKKKKTMPEGNLKKKKMTSNNNIFCRKCLYVLCYKNHINTIIIIHMTIKKKYPLLHVCFSINT
jgi:hypothetical protein